jgi:hypothetical protein
LSADEITAGEYDVSYEKPTNTRLAKLKSIVKEAAVGNESSVSFREDSYMIDNTINKTPGSDHIQICQDYYSKESDTSILVVDIKENNRPTNPEVVFIEGKTDISEIIPASSKKDEPEILTATSNWLASRKRGKVSRKPSRTRSATNRELKPILKVPRKKSVRFAEDTSHSEFEKKIIEESQEENMERKVAYRNPTPRVRNLQIAVTEQVEQVQVQEPPKIMNPIHMQAEDRMQPKITGPVFKNPMLTPVPNYADHQSRRHRRMGSDLANVRGNIDSTSEFEEGPRVSQVSRRNYRTQLIEGYRESEKSPTDGFFRKLGKLLSFNCVKKN